MKSGRRFAKSRQLLAFPDADRLRHKRLLKRWCYRVVEQNGGRRTYMLSAVDCVWNIMAFNNQFYACIRYVCCGRRTMKPYRAGAGGGFC